VIGRTVEMSTPGPQRHRHPRRAQAALAFACTAALSLAAAPVAVASLSRSAYKAQRACATPPPGSAACLGVRLVTVGLTEADLAANAKREAAEATAGSPAVANKQPIAGGLTPELLHAAYALPNATFPASQQTVAVVDAFNDPTAEADLAVYDKQFGLPECTSASGCFRKLNQEGRTSPLPQREGGWATEISLDVQMAHAICQSCHVLLVEADNESFANLGAAVNAAVSAGATEVSNSYGGAEQSGYTAYNGPYDHPGVVITASAGDCGYFNEACHGLEAANFPASSPDVVAVGGTTLSESGETWTSTVWEGGGSGCSTVFDAPSWQSAVAGFSATACDSGRSVGDVAAVGNPYTGVDVYDSTANPGGYPTGWGVWGGTSVASPVIAAEFGLGGGAHGVEYPAATLYSHIGESSALYDVVSGSNGSCTDASSCSARHGYDGPTGVGSPVGLRAFATAVSPAEISPPSISGTAEQGQTLSLTHGDWSGTPSTYGERWLLCNASGGGCSAISGVSGSTYVLPASAVGSTIRVQETAANASGSGSPVVSSATAAVISDAPVVTSFTPSTGLTGSSVTITGTGFTGATAVRVDGVKTTFTVHSATQVEATVPNGADAGTISLTTPVATGTSAGKFTPTLSLHSFSPTKAAPGTSVTLTGLGFEKGSTVSFGGVKATSVTYVSSLKLKVLVPPEAASGAIQVTNPTAPSGTVSSATSFTAA
jgi:hypothetical protein